MLLTLRELHLLVSKNIVDMITKSTFLIVLDQLIHIKTKVKNKLEPSILLEQAIRLRDYLNDSTQPWTTLLNVKTRF